MRKVPTPAASGAEPTRLQPTRRFALVSGGVLVAAALLLGALYHFWADSELEAMAEQNNVAMARVFENHLLRQNRDFFTDAGRRPRPHARHRYRQGQDLRWTRPYGLLDRCQRDRPRQ